MEFSILMMTIGGGDKVAVHYGDLFPAKSDNLKN
jgi:hypothetical protein